MNPTLNSTDLQFWREEKTADAVYAVYLKKVRYRSSTDLDEADSGSAHLLWQTHKVWIIKAGNLERLVESLVLETGDIDSAHVNIFLATYRSFSTPQDVVRLLISRHKSLDEDEQLKEELKDLHMKTIRSIISMWIDTYPDDFTEDKYPCINQLLDYFEVWKQDADLVNKLKDKMSVLEIQKDKDSCSATVGVDYRFNLCDEVDLLTKQHTPVEFMYLPTAVFAEQLTLIDANLFKAVVPHHCLGSVWSHRDAPSVAATIKQFNAVSYRVIATVLKNTLLKASRRAKLISKWIDIAQELRVLKNFSSLKAILSGLQANSVYRLRKTWSAVPKASMSQFEELSEIFCEENNQITSRELLQREGTAKFANLERSSSKVMRKKSMQKQRTWMENGVIQGTVPYLGTFLTDLTMFDTAMPDTIEEGLINFEKKRKEFEVIVQIKLLQKAAANYTISSNEQFLDWFHSVKTYSDNESHSLSCEIEEIPASPKHTSIKKKYSFGHRQNDLEGSQKSTQEDQHSLDSLVPSPISDVPEALLGSDVSVAFRSSDSCVIKITLETDDSDDSNIYKSIMLSNRDHTKVVLQNALSKFNVDEDPHHYCICQALSDGSELKIPDQANVFYAMNNSGILTFIIRTKEYQKLLGSLPKKKQSKYTMKTEITNKSVFS